MTRGRVSSLARLLISGLIATLFALAAHTLVVSAAGTPGSPKQADIRLALVIGNSDYTHVERLTNPRADAELMARLLREQLGFEVTVVFDADRVAMLASVGDFVARLKSKGSSSVGLVYFAGHGYEHAGGNFLGPIDLLLNSEEDAALRGVSVDEVAGLLSSAGNQLNVLVLDACRNNAFGSKTRAIQARGLSPMGSVVGVYIASSTAAGDEALDGEGANSPYTTALAETIVLPGMKLEDVFKSVRRRVRLATKNRQIPWESSSLEVDFYFIPSDAKQAMAALGRDTTELTGRPLNAAIQRELLRTGCSKGGVTENFDAMTIAGLRAFALLTDDKFHWHRGTMAALHALRRFDGKASCEVATLATPTACFKVADDLFCK